MSEPAAAADAGPKVLSVKELVALLTVSLQRGFSHVWVEGEVASLHDRGHIYFTLKDERKEALIDCILFQASRPLGGSHLIEGARVQVCATPTIYAGRGRLQLRVESVKAVGRGSLLEALERLKEKLAAEGLFSPERKRPLPAEPRAVGIVTSREGAAIGDICKVAFRRGRAHLVLAPARVQGAGAPESIIQAITLLEAHPEVDVIIVGRGGGAKEDLLAFNDERVVRCVGRARVPVVSAVGHEIDVSLTDLVADARAATPSQGAELVIADAVARGERTRRLQAQLARALSGRIAREQSRLDRLRSRLSDPRFLVHEHQQRLDELTHGLSRLATLGLTNRARRLDELRRDLFARHPRAVLARGGARLAPLETRLRSALETRVAHEVGALRAATRALSPAIASCLARHRGELSELAARLDALSPLKVLGRGYAIAVRKNGKVIRKPTDARAGERFTLRLAQGALEARVVADHPGQGELFGSADPN